MYEQAVPSMGVGMGIMAFIYFIVPLVSFICMIVVSWGAVSMAGSLKRIADSK